MVYPIAKRLITPAVKLYIKKIKGIRNVPKKGPFIVAANHESYMDHFVIQTTLISYLNKKIRYMAKKEHFDKFFERLWHVYFGAIPVDRKAGGKEALKWAINALNENKIVGIYPEGTRTLDGKMNKGKTGAIRLALYAKVPILPIGLDGCFELLPKGKKMKKRNFKSITINIGEPITYENYFEKAEDYETLRKLTDELMKKIAKLANTEYPY